MSGDPAIGFIVLFILLAFVVGIILKPGLVLVFCGLIIVFAGLFSLAIGTIFGISFGTPVIVSGIGLIGFGRLIEFIESLLAETRGMRADLGTLRSEARQIKTMPLASPPPEPRKTPILDVRSDLIEPQKPPQRGFFSRLAGH